MAIFSAKMVSLRVSREKMGIFLAKMVSFRVIHAEIYKYQFYS